MNLQALDEEPDVLLYSPVEAVQWAALKIAAALIFQGSDDDVSQAHLGFLNGPAPERITEKQQVVEGSVELRLRFFVPW